MPLLATVKRASIAVGLYGPARWASRKLRPEQLVALHADIEFYRSLLQPGDLSFDVGANVGDKSEALLDIGARVVSFEPNPRVLPELRARCAGRSNWALVPTALGSSAAIAKLWARDPDEESSLTEQWYGAIVGAHSVPVVTLDSAIQHFGCPAFCKIDVEGWELEVLRGLSQPIPLLSFEFHLSDTPQIFACLQRLQQLGAHDINVAPAEKSFFLFHEWIPLEQFVSALPTQLETSLPGQPGHQYGDIFVRSAVS